MAHITVLDQNTINKIAAGEVIERPAAVVKELIENAIDAGANAITAEIKEGGIQFIRITDNGMGIPKEEVAVAFLRHSTSKIRSVEDLILVSSLGFRGEALSSIAAVSQVELVTKTSQSLTGVRYVIEGGEEKNIEEIGSPEGTTFLIRNLFYNTPARRKFLKSPTTEAGYISELIERLAISHPNVSFKYIVNGQIKLQTSGNNNIKDIIYHIYGRELASNLLTIDGEGEHIKVTGYVGKPVISRGNRNYMNYYINGRYIKSSMIHKAIEEAYKSYTMSHRYPFTALHINIDKEMLDVNVHPTKMEIRFKNHEEVYDVIYNAIKEALAGKNLIPDVTLVAPEKEEKKIISVPEPFEKHRMESYRNKAMVKHTYNIEPIPEVIQDTEIGKLHSASNLVKENTDYEETTNQSRSYDHKTEQLSLFEESILSNEGKKNNRIIGQVFATYWIVELQDKMYIIDQHAAHEKVLYEKIMASIRNKDYSSQLLSPPIIVPLNMREEEVFLKHKEELYLLGFEVESFGGKEYSIGAVPSDMYGIEPKDLFIEIIDGLVDNNPTNNQDIILEKIATISCKAAVKGNNTISQQEAESLIEQLLTLDNPYHCPHGRPTIVAMSKYEIEKKFKRIV